MALTQAAITFDVSDYASADFDPRRTKVYSTNNVPGGTVIDTVGNHIFLGSGTGTIGADGTGSISVPTPGTGSNPDSWQTTVHIDYPDRNAPSGRTVKSFGPFTITTSGNLADLVAEMPVQPEYAAEVFDRLDALEADSGVGDALAELEDRVDGVQDHGNVSGTVTLDPANGYHVFDATGATEVSLGDPPGYSLAFKAITGADDVTVDGLADFTLTDDAWATFVHYRNSWHLAASGASGGGDVEPVIDPPTQPGAITVDPTSDGYNLSWVASTVAAGYEGQVDGGTYTDYGSDLAQAIHGLQPSSSHTGGIRAYNTLGEKSTPRTWGPVSTDAMSVADQIMAYNPRFYVRFDEGTVHTVAGPTWSVPGGYTAPAFTGPPIVAGDTLSAEFVANSRLTATGADFAGMTSFTAIYVIGVPNVVSHYGRLGMAGLDVAWDVESYSPWKPTSRGVVFIQWAGGSTNGSIYYNSSTDGGNSNLSMPASGPTLAQDTMYIHGNQYGGSDKNDGYASHMAIIPNRLLTQGERNALVQAVGTP